MLHVEISPPVPEKIFEGFLPYGHGGHLGHVTRIIYVHIGSLSYRSFISNLVLTDLPVSEKKIFQHYGDIHLYCPVVGHASPWVQFFRIINFQSIYPFPSSFSLQMTFDNFPHSNAWATYVDIAVK